MSVSHGPYPVSSTHTSPYLIPPTLAHQVHFYTNATVFDAIPTGGLNGTGDGAGDGSGNRTTSARCEAVGLR